MRHLHLEQRLERSAVMGATAGRSLLLGCDALRDIFRSVGWSGKIDLLRELGEKAAAGLFGVASSRHPVRRRRST